MTTQSADAIISPAAAVVPLAHPIPLEVYETARQLNVLHYLPQVIDLTREIYGGFSRVSVDVDPDVGDTHIVFDVPVMDSIEEVLGKDEQWGRRLLAIIPRSPRVYLVSTYFQS